MRGKHAAALAGFSVFAGYYIGAISHDHIPETRVVTVEKPVVHIKHEKETVYETRPLPDSCETAIDMVQIVTDAGGDVGRRAAEMVEAIATVNPTIMQDPMKVNEVYGSLNTSKIKLDDALTIQLQKNTSLDFKLDACIADIEASNNGDDVAPLDGVAGATP